MIVFPLIMLLILLAIGFGVGFWILVTAIRQEPAWLRILGSIFGWILIVLATITSLLGLYYAGRFARTGYMHRGCPMYQMMHDRETQEEYRDNYEDMPMMQQSKR